MQFPRHNRFVVEPEIAREFIRQERRNDEVVHPFLIDREMLVEGEPQRIVIDFQKRNLSKHRVIANLSNTYGVPCCRMLKNWPANSVTIPGNRRAKSLVAKNVVATLPKPERTDR